MKRIIWLPVVMLFAATPLFAQPPELSWSVFSGLGGQFSGDTIQINCTLGQPITGPMTGNNIILYAGFWVPGGCFYIPGDANSTGIFNGIDVTYAVNYLKGVGPAPPDSCDCVATDYPFYGAADANGDCHFNGIDVTYMVNYLKGIGPTPRPCTDCSPGGLLPKVKAK